MTTKPLLTVAIPAYNRPERLEIILKELAQQYTEQFVVLVSDDCSTEDIHSVVLKYSEALPNIIYHRNAKNLGYSGNVCTLYELADTKYVWFLCDDDTVLPKAIENIVNTLNEYNPRVAVYNYEQIDPYGKKLTIGPNETLVYDNLATLNDYQPIMRVTFLSILVVEKSLAVDVIKQTNYTDNVYFQLTLALLLLSDRFSFCEINKTILRRNVGYRYGDFFKFYLVDHLKAVYAVQTKFDSNKFIGWSKRDIFNAFKLYLSQKLGLFTYSKAPSMETVSLIKQYYGILGRVILLFPLFRAVIPTFVLKIYYLIVLILMHGYVNGLKFYNDNVNRAVTDTRKGGFTTYQ